MLLLGAEAHDVLDTGPVVPTPVEEDYFPGGGKVFGVALEVPLGALALGGFGERDDARHARIEKFRDPLDGAALAGRVAPFEDDNDAGALGAHPLLKFHQFRLQPVQLAFVQLTRHFRGLLRPLLDCHATTLWRK